MATEGMTLRDTDRPEGEDDSNQDRADEARDGELMQQREARCGRRKHDALEGSGPPLLGGSDISPQLPGLGFGLVDICHIVPAARQVAGELTSMKITLCVRQSVGLSTAQGTLVKGPSRNSLARISEFTGGRGRI